MIHPTVKQKLHRHAGASGVRFGVRPALFAVRGEQLEDEWRQALFAARIAKRSTITLQETVGVEGLLVHLFEQGEHVAKSDCNVRGANGETRIVNELVQ